MSRPRHAGAQRHRLPPRPARSQPPGVRPQGDERERGPTLRGRDRVPERPPGLGRQPSAAGRPPRNQLFAEPQGVGTVQFTHVCLEVAASSLTNKQTDGTFLAGKDSRDKNGLSSLAPSRARGAHALQFSLRKPGSPTVLCCRSPGAPCCGPLLANVLPACQGKLAFALRRRLTEKWVRRRWLVHTQGEEDTGLFGGPPRGTWWLPRGCPGADRH